MTQSKTTEDWSFGDVAAYRLVFWGRCGLSIGLLGTLRPIDWSFGDVAAYRLDSSDPSDRR